MKSTLFILFCVALIHIVFAADVSDPLYEGETWVEEGNGFAIVCKIPMQEPYALQWTRNDQPLNLSMGKDVGYSIMDDVRESESLLVSVLRVRQAEYMHSGSYRCNKFSSRGHLVLVLSADDMEEVQFKLGQPELILNCTVSSAAEVQWFRNGTKLSEKDNVKFSNEDGTHSITITKPKKEDIGSYSCMADGPRSMNKDFRVSMEPVVVKFSTSSNVVEGERFRLPCVVYGYPTPKVEWRRAGEGEDVWENIEANDRFMFENNNEGIEGATLVITEVKMEDRDDYMCFASNDLGSANSTILIRVIDKYAALWPFLGICAEVIVLCTIIFIFERRRSKKMQFDEAEEQQNNSKHAGNASKDSEVRNRK